MHWLARPDVQKVSHNLGILNIRAFCYHLVAWTGLCNLLELETRLDQQVEPFANGSREYWDLEFR